MHVAISKVTDMVVSVGWTKEGPCIQRNDPKDGYWKVVWVRKRKGRAHDVSCILTKRKAQDLANTLNALSGRHVGFLVRSLHAAGAESQRDHQRKNTHYTGRSFARD